MLLTHAVNVLLLERAIRGFTGDLVLSCVGAVLWGTCPVLEGALGWYSAYGQVLLSVFAFYPEPVLTAALAPRYQYLPLAWGSYRGARRAQRAGRPSGLNP